MEEETTPAAQDAPVPEITEEQVNVDQDTDQNQNNDNGTEDETAAESAPDQPESTDVPTGGEGEVTDTPQTTDATPDESEPVTAEPADQGEGGEPQPGNGETPIVGQEETPAPTDGPATESQPGEGQDSEDKGEGGTRADGEAGGTLQTEGGEQEQPVGEEGAEQAPVLGDEAVATEGEEATVTEGQEAEQTSADQETSAEPQTEVEPQIQVQQEDVERAESPMAVGVKLSREGSPAALVIDPDHMPEMLEPSTPDEPSEAGDADLSQQEMMDEEESDEPEFDREQLIERYHAAIQERDQLQQQNYQLQHKIAEYFRKKKSDDSRQDFDKNVSDQEQRYIKYMANLEELRKQEGQEQENYCVQIEELKERCGEKQERVEGERQRFIEFKKQVAVNSLNSRSGKSIPPKDIEQYLSIENRKDNDVVNVRLENIKLKNKLKKKEQQLKSKEELAEGLHLIDFEQLKIENQTYNEKIEERNEELLKLRKKITSTVQVLTHLKEKLQFVQAENQVQNSRLKEVEAVAAQKRDVLSRTKQARDALRIDNQKLRQNCGLLGNESLLRDFEEQRDKSDDLNMKLERLRMQHAELTLNCSQLRRKIEQVRANQM